MQDILKLKEVLEIPQNIIITTHHKPDADALGSSLGLYNYLIKKGHQVTVITPSDYADFLAWMKGNDKVVVFSDGNESLSQSLVNKADIIFCLDFSNLKRIKELGELVRNSSAKKVLIDHHREPEQFADYGYHDVGSASTAQLVYKTIVAYGDKHLVDKDIAECFYAGIMTDTGSFKHPNTNKEVHEIVAELIDLGANNSEVSRLIYDTNSLDRLKFLGFALSQRLKVFPEYHVAYFAISMKDLEKFKSRTGDTEGLVNYALSINGITMAALFTESEEGVKLSLRSIGDFEVNTLAAHYFNGGGHKNAAGGISYKSLDDTVAFFENIIKEYSVQLKNKKPIETYV
ncbi:bifunctional oligoribonuclease/PAP phosphatase NrnA [Marivirga sp. S37H4]|uniref:Bifunctional oligoribonuclease/PAP phosphatase NrnA n=1 Tax=Marivirga aurantiaca TaxID=2802615 RepID=A0A934WZQ7_9BACT|nr:bifunctional oligoribonuclease/PAP phosphatase NrnA [Marivirga aurantiaca]MBK6265881.1 bifunctional oligoribonuclease/PAP phosphatase NrnA [Marivirga aurantiaca]